MISAWTDRLHDAGYQSGYYSSAASGIAMLDRARQDPADDHKLPDRIWVAHYVDSDASCRLSWGKTSTQYLSDEAWERHRMRQYCGTHTETYGGVGLSIDSNYTDFGRGTVSPKAAPHCGVRVDFTRYPKLSRGDRGEKVQAAQCFLRQANVYDGRVDGRYTRPTAQAVRRFQHQAAIPVSGTLDGRSWTALLSRGSDPLLKYGSRSDAVRRLQRALNVAAKSELDVDGVFGWATMAAVKDYQRARDLHRCGVVDDEVWALLQLGRR